MFQEVARVEEESETSLQVVCWRCWMPAMPHTACIAWYLKILHGIWSIAWYLKILHGIWSYCMVLCGIVWNCVVVCWPCLTPAKPHTAGIERAHPVTHPVGMVRYWGGCIHTRTLHPARTPFYPGPDGLVVLHNWRYPVGTTHYPVSKLDALWTSATRCIPPCMSCQPVGGAFILGV